MVLLVIRQILRESRLMGEIIPFEHTKFEMPFSYPWGEIWVREFHWEVEAENTDLRSHANCVGGNDPGNGALSQQEPGWLSFSFSRSRSPLEFTLPCGTAAVFLLLPSSSFFPAYLILKYHFDIELSLLPNISDPGKIQPIFIIPSASLPGLIISNVLWFRMAFSLVSPEASTF